MTIKIRMRGKSKAGLAEIKALIKHPMESGVRMNKKTGKPYPAKYIDLVEILVNDKKIITNVLNKTIKDLEEKSIALEFQKELLEEQQFGRYLPIKRSARKLQKLVNAKIEEIEINESTRNVLVSENEVSMTKKEFDLLLLLARNRGIVFSRDELLNKVWGFDYYDGTRTVDVHILNIRKKIEMVPKKPKHIKTVVGLGYKFE